MDVDLALYSARLASQTLWKIAVKKGLVRSIKNGEVLYFAASMSILMALYETDVSTIPTGIVQTALGRISGKMELELAAKVERQVDDLP